MASFVSGVVVPDYGARIAFLEATRLIVPSPMDVLAAEIRPMFRRWAQGFSDEPDEPLGRLTRSVATLELFFGPNPALRKELDAWMDRYRFADRWILDAAEKTLLTDNVARRRWVVQPEWEHLEPPCPPPRGSESTEAYLKRAKREVRACKRRAIGARPNQQKPAEWTVRKHFLGESYVDMGEREHLDADVIRKAVHAFCARAGLTIPHDDVSL